MYIDYMNNNPYVKISKPKKHNPYVVSDYYSIPKKEPIPGAIKKRLQEDASAIEAFQSQQDSLQKEINELSQKAQTNRSDSAKLKEEKPTKEEERLHLIKLQKLGEEYAKLQHAIELKSLDLRHLQEKNAPIQEAVEKGIGEMLNNFVNTIPDSTTKVFETLQHNLKKLKEDAQDVVDIDFEQHDKYMETLQETIEALEKKVEESGKASSEDAVKIEEEVTNLKTKFDTTVQAVEQSIETARKQEEEFKSSLQDVNTGVLELNQIIQQLQQFGVTKKDLDPLLRKAEKEGHLKSRPAKKQYWKWIAEKSSQDEKKAIFTFLEADLRALIKSKTPKVSDTTKKTPEQQEQIAKIEESIGSIFGDNDLPAINDPDDISKAAQVKIEGLNFYGGEAWNKELPQRAKDYLAVNGDRVISGIEIAKAPVSDAIEQALNVVSLGSIGKVKKELSIDKLFHTWMLVYLKGPDPKTVLIEKNGRVFIGDAYPEQAEYVLQVKTPPNMTLNELVMNGANRLIEWGLNPWAYDGAYNNCQVFMKALLAGFGASNDEFLIQNTKELFSRLSPIVKSTADAVVSAQQVADVLFSGYGVTGGRKSKKSKKSKGTKGIKKLIKRNPYV